MLWSDVRAAAGDTGDTTPGAEDTTLEGAGVTTPEADTTGWLPEDIFYKRRELILYSLEE